jgi:hypothetical protein
MQHNAVLTCLDGAPATMAEYARTSSSPAQASSHHHHHSAPTPQCSPPFGFKEGKIYWLAIHSNLAIEPFDQADCRRPTALPPPIRHAKRPYSRRCSAPCRTKNNGGTPTPPWCATALVCHQRSHCISLVTNIEHTSKEHQSTCSGHLSKPYDLRQSTAPATQVPPSQDSGAARWILYLGAN